MMTKTGKRPTYFGVIGNRDYIKRNGEKRPFWEYLDTQPGGWLTSLAYKRKDLPCDRPIIYDCGAWSYRNENVPPIDATSALSAYVEHAPSGATIIAPDHMLIDGVDVGWRREWNRQQAAQFIDGCPMQYTPMATIHGMNIDERLAHAQWLADVGYTHIAIGGLAARASQKRLMIGMVRQIRKQVPTLRLHALGLSSPDYMSNWRDIGIDSCDGSSHFKQAFTGGAFFTVIGKKLSKHKAIRKGEPLGDIPLCDCRACSILRLEKIDTRAYGSNESNMGRAAHNLNMLMVAQQAAMRHHIVLVACCGKKKSGCPRAAEEIYDSELFRKSKEYAKRHGDQWFILSAKHGLLDPTTVIGEYDLALTTAGKKYRNKWYANISKEMRQYRGDKITVLAGNVYCGWLGDLDVDRPLKGMGIGQQLQWLKANNIKYNDKQGELW